jgi:predicted Zn-dependent peptidase
MEGQRAAIRQALNTIGSDEVRNVARKYFADDKLIVCRIQPDKQ